MSEPKAYGFCPAGCRYEVVKMEDFQEAAPCIQLPMNSTGKTKLEVGRKYKIYSESFGIAWKARMTVTVSTISAYQVSEILANGYYDQYRGYFYFQLFSVTYADNQCTAVYEVNGNRKTNVFNVPASIQDDDTKLYVEGAQKIFAVNDGANEFEVTGVGIEGIAKTGTSGLVDTYTITLTNGDTYTFTVTNGSSGSGGLTENQINLLETFKTSLNTLFDHLGYDSATSGDASADAVISALESLISSLRGSTPPEGNTDNITVSDGVMTIASLANNPQQMTDILVIS